MKRSIKLKYFLYTVLFGIFCLLLISYVHAYRFTHFSDTSHPRTDPRKLALTDKISLLFTGIRNPHQRDTILPGIAYQTFVIQSDKKLESWFIPKDSAKGLILLFHGYAGNKSQMLSRAMDLHQSGYATAIIGFRGSGNSEGNYTTIGVEESKDVRASYRFYKEMFPELPVFLFGTSMGAASILKAFDPEPLPVKGIILEYPFGSLHQSVKNRFKVMGFPSFPMANLLTLFGGWQLGFNAFEHNPEEYARKVNCPVLYLAGDHDDRVTNEETAAVFQNLKTSDKTLHIFKGGGHESLNENFRKEWLFECTKFINDHE